MTDSPTLPLCAGRVKSGGAAADTSPSHRLSADICLLFETLVLALCIVAGIFLGRMLADMLLAAWAQALICISAFLGVIWYIVADLRRVFRLAESRRVNR